MLRRRLMKFSWLIPGALIILSSCMKDNSDDLQAEHDNDLRVLLSKYGMTDADQIETGIWLKISDTDKDSSGIFPAAEDYVVVEVLGSYSDGEVFDVSDSAIAQAEGVYRSDLVYGPMRLKLENTFYGFYLAMQEVPRGASAKMVFSHENAFGGYKPVAYEVKLYNVITNFNTYLSTEYFTYLDRMDLNLSDTLSSQDSSVFSRILTEGTSVADIQVGDSVYINLQAYYAETDPTFVQQFPGRQYFPINESGTLVKILVGKESFPYVNGMFRVIERMKIGETREVLLPPSYVYGSNGFRHPYVGKFIVPPDMPVHCIIELLSTKIN